MGNQDVSLSDKQWKQIEELENFKIPLSDKNVSRSQIVLKRMEKVRTFLIANTQFSCKNNAT